MREVLLPRLRDQDDRQVSAVVIRAITHKIRLVFIVIPIGVEESLAVNIKRCLDFARHDKTPKCNSRSVLCPYLLRAGANAAALADPFNCVCCA